MPKFSMDQIDNYSNNSGADFFSLKNDGDTCRVRILYDSVNDVEGNCFHGIRGADNRFYRVNCLRSYDEPADLCPLCSSANFDDRKLTTKIFIPLYIIETGEVKLWERGTKFYKEILLPLMIEKGTPFCGSTFTIERHGAAGDMSTTYELVWEGFDETTLEDFEEIPCASGTVVLDKTFEELDKFAKNRTFDDVAVPVRRGGKTTGGSNNDSNGGGYRRRGVSRPDME